MFVYNNHPKKRKEKKEEKKKEKKKSVLFGIYQIATVPVFLSFQVFSLNF